MVEALHLGSIALAAVGACCAAAASGRDRVLGILTALLMLTAMIDTTLWLTGIPAVGWALALMLAGVVLGGISSHHRAGADPSRMRNPNHLMLHRNIGLILMAGLIVVMDGHTHGITDTHAAHGGLNLLHPVLGGGCVLYLVVSIWLAARGAKTGTPHRLETASMGLSVLTMGSAWLI